MNKYFFQLTNSGECDETIYICTNEIICICFNQTTTATAKAIVLNYLLMTFYAFTSMPGMAYSLKISNSKIENVHKHKEVAVGS